CHTSATKNCHRRSEHTYPITPKIFSGRPSTMLGRNMAFPTKEIAKRSRIVSRGLPSNAATERPTANGSKRTLTNDAAARVVHARRIEGLRWPGGKGTGHATLTGRGARF